MAIEDIRYAVRKKWKNSCETRGGELVIGGRGEIILETEEELQVKVDGSWLPVRYEVTEDESQSKPLGRYGIDEDVFLSALDPSPLLPRRSLTINGHEFVVPTSHLTYEEIVELAGYSEGSQPTMVAVRRSRSGGSRSGWSLLPGMSVVVKEGLSIDVADTSKA